MIIRLSYTCKSQRFQSLTLLYISTVFRSYLSFPNFNSTISPNFFHVCTFICLVWRYVVYLLHTDHICNYLHTYSTNDNQKCLSRATQILQQWLELYSGAYPENTNSRWWGQYILFCLFVICHWETFFCCWWSSEMIGWSCSQGKKYHRNQLENICSLIVFLDENFGIGIFLKVGKIIGHLFSACFNSLVWSSMKITFLGLIFFSLKNMDQAYMSLQNVVGYFPNS